VAGGQLRGVARRVGGHGPLPRVAAGGVPAACLEGYEASQVARGFSQTTMDNWAGALERFLAACGRPAWEVTWEDIDRVVAGGVPGVFGL
jgi:hypothetical protein